MKRFRALCERARHGRRVISCPNVRIRPHILPAGACGQVLHIAGNYRLGLLQDDNKLLISTIVVRRSSMQPALETAVS